MKMTDPFDEVIETAQMKGIALTALEEAALRGRADPRQVRDALSIFDSAPFMFHNILKTALYSSKLVKTPMRAGGEKMAEGKKLTLEELRTKTAKAIKEATEFERAPAFDMRIGTEILFRVKRAIDGNFEGKLVITDDLRVLNVTTGKFEKMALDAYTQEGKDGPRSTMKVDPGKDIRVPSFVARAAKRKGLDFVPKFVYWSKYVEDKKVEKGTFKVTAVDIVGSEFPEA